MAITLDGSNGILSPDFEPSSSTTPTNGLFLPAANTVGLATGSTERLRIDSSGNLGLGVTPSGWSTGKAIETGYLGSAFWGYSAAQNFLTSNCFYNSGWKYATTGAATYYTQAGGHYWYTAPSGTAGAAISFTQAMTLDASGNLLVGTTSIASGFSGFAQIEASGSQGGIVINSATNNLARLIFTSNNTFGNEGLIRYDTSNSSMQFWTAATERARIDSSGNLLVGKTASSQTSGEGVQLSPTTAAVNSYMAIVSPNSLTGTNIISAYSTGAANFRFYVQWDGKIYATSTSITAISDISLKENIRPLETGLAEVLALKPRRFDWKNGDGNNVAGFIAQEVETVLPDLVSDYKYNEEETKRGLKMGDMIPTLVKAIQELTARLEALEAK